MFRKFVSRCLNHENQYQYEYAKDHISFKRLIPYRLESSMKFIYFEYLENFIENFPTILPYEIVELALEYTSCMNVLKERINSVSTCHVCNVYRHERGFNIICSRCNGFFCSTCWKDNYIVDSGMRNLTLNEGTDDVYGLFIKYNDCPICCCGLT